MTLTLDEVRKTKFHMARRTGYEVSEVDLFVDRVEASFAQLTEENSMLKQQVETLKQAQQNTRQREEGREPTNEELAKQPAPRPQPQVQQVTSAPTGASDKIVVTTGAEASPAVIRLVQMATEQAEVLVDEAEADAKRKVEEAQHRAHQISTDARTKADRIESEARVNAEKMTSDAKSRAENLDRETASRRTQLFSDLESERDRLRDAVTQLRGFEASYRQNLTNHLKQQISSIESGRFEPNDKPGLLERGKNESRSDEPSGRRSFGNNPNNTDAKDSSSSTPRLDALLGGDGNNTNN